MSFITGIPAQFLTEHAAWHTQHHYVTSTGEGVEFLLFHRDFIERVFDYLRTRPDVDRALLAPWTDIPGDVKGAVYRGEHQHGAPAPEYRWEPPHDALIKRLTTDIASFDSVDQLGLAMNDGSQAPALHGLTHLLIQAAYGDDMAPSRAPESTYFYQLHGYLDRFLTAWVQRAGPGRLWHVARDAAGGWSRAYDGDVSVPTGGHVRDVVRTACAVGGPELHVLAVRPDGTLWHTLRRGDGSWFPFGDVGYQAGRPGFVRDVTCAWDGAQLHVAAVTDDSVWHSVRRADGTWSKLGSVGGLAGFAGAMSLAAAAGGGLFHLLATTPDGGVRHTLRGADGAWTPWGNVLGQTGSPGYVDRAGAAVANGDLHVVTVTSAGGVHHAVRFAAGSWTKHGDVVAATGGGQPGPFENVACAAANGALHVVLTNQRQALVHTIRRADGTWFPLGNATAATGSEDIPRIGDVGATTMGDDLHLVVLSQAR
jgi:hypothetical protein